MYDAFSIDYDRFVNWPSRLAYELPFIGMLLKTIQGSVVKKRVLDAACGTGWHVIALAEKGFDTFGADISSGMIDRAKENSRNRGSFVEFKAVGFTDLKEAYNRDKATPFDAVLCLGNSLPHITNPPELGQALANFAGCLKPGGILLIQNRNFDAVMAGHQRWMEPQSVIEGQSEWLFIRFYDFTKDGLIDFNIMTLRRENSHLWQQKINTTRLRPILSGEMMTGLEEAGFEEIVFYGDMTGAPFDSGSSGNLVVAAKKSATTL